MNNKKVLLCLAGLLIIVGITKPDLKQWFSGSDTISVDEIVVVTPPSDNKLREVCEPVITSLKDGDSNRVKDGKRLANLYMDIARLIELDGEDVVIKNTDEIRYANSLSGVMLRMDIKGKYPKLPENAKAVIVTGIGDDNVPLDAGLRQKAAESFRALAWACVEGTK
jgi:hypothetical protein